MQIMLNNISWGTYVSVSLLLLVVYYVVVGAKFYSNEIKALLSGKTKPSFRTASTTSLQDDEEPTTESAQVQSELFTPDENYTPMYGEEASDTTLEQVRELTHCIKDAIAEAVEKNHIKEEFILSLQLLLKKYSFLKGSPSLGALNNLIASECEKYGYIQLSAEERVLLWNE